MQRPSRRRFLAAAAAAGLAGLAGCRGNGPMPTPPGTDTSTPGGSGTGAPTGQALVDLELAGEPVASGFASPVAVATEPSTDRHVVVDQFDGIYVGTDGDGDPFLDLSEAIVDVSGYSEQGVLGIAFHPAYPDNGRFYVRYSAPNRDGTPDTYSHTFVLSEFTAEPGADSVDRSTERTLLEIPEPQSNHNAGDVAFGPDGYLYVPVGDGGGANDQGTGHVDDWYDAVDGGNGQAVEANLLGSILRIDVDDRDGDQPYGIPEDNPLVGEDGRDEQYAWGFRNPWRISFGPEGRLFAADVGQNEYEEVDVVERGGNYGWNVREGTHCFQAEECPSETDDGETLRDPIIEYSQGGGEVGGAAVIGGHLYDGSAIPTLRGRYVFADWQAGGDLFVATEVEQGLWPVEVVPIAGLNPRILAFGLDQTGELLVCSTGENGGAVHRVTKA